MVISETETAPYQGVLFFSEQEFGVLEYFTWNDFISSVLKIQYFRLHLGKYNPISEIQTTFFFSLLTVNCTGWADIQYSAVEPLLPSVLMGSSWVALYLYMHTWVCLWIRDWSSAGNAFWWVKGRGYFLRAPSAVSAEIKSSKSIFEICL